MPAELLTRRPSLGEAARAPPGKAPCILARALMPAPVAADAIDPPPAITPRLSEGSSQAFFFRVPETRSPRNPCAAAKPSRLAIRLTVAPRVLLQTRDQLPPACLTGMLLSEFGGLGSDARPRSLDHQLDRSASLIARSTTFFVPAILRPPGAEFHSVMPRFDG